MKIHMISNSLNQNSGFSIVTKEIVLGLKKLGYDVSMTGLQTAYLPEYHYGIECFPIQTDRNDETGQFIQNIVEVDPDCVIYVGQMDADLNNLTKVFKKTIAYVPVEGIEIPTMMTNDLKFVIQNGGKIVSQCFYGQNEMRKVGVESVCIYHGYDNKSYYKLNDNELNNLNSIIKCYYATDVGRESSDPRILCERGCYNCEGHRIENKIEKCPNFKEEEMSILKWINGKWSQFAIPISKLKEVLKDRDKKFLYIHVGQNFGIRKRQERLIKAFSLMIGESKMMRDRTHLHMHCLPISVRGINLIDVIRKLGIENNVTFSYGSTRSNAYSDEAMNILYNLADCNVSASSSEGFGIPTLISMACGVPNIGPACSSFVELIGDGEKGEKGARGYLANIESWQMTQDGCLLQDTPILTTERGIQKIQDIKVGDRILTHKGRFMKVSQVMKREYVGDMIKISPHKLRIPICLTPEHQVFGVKTEPCTVSGNAVCHSERNCYYTDNRRLGKLYKKCKYIKGDEPFTKYKTEWIDAKDLKIGDYVTYPRFKEKIVDIDKIRILDYIDDFLNITGDNYDDDTIQTDIFGGFVEKKIKMYGNNVTNAKDIPSEIELTGDLMRLFGYFIAEGNNSEYNLTFTFNINENEYISDVEKLIRDIFGLGCRHYINEEGHKHEVTVGNKILSNLFQNMFCPNEYKTKKGKGSKANIVRIPPEFMNLPLNKLAELIKGEYRGDGSFESYEYNIVTSSETLANQLLCILSRFNILVSIYKNNNKDGIIYRVGIQGKDVEIFDKIIGEKHEYGERNKSSQYLKGRNLFFTPIKNIDIIGHNGYVWNLEVEEDNTYVPTIVVHNSFRALVDQRDLALKMKMAYVEKDKMKVFSKNGIEWAKNHTWDKKVEEWDVLLKNL